MSALMYHAEVALRRQLQEGNNDTFAPSEWFGTEAATLEPTYTGSISTAPPIYVDPSQARGRTVLTILYLCVLALCFVVPVFYYFRLHCFEQQARRELELDVEEFHAAMEQNEQQREESRAARRKYMEERRARILQLFQPVRMVSKATKQHFGYHLVGVDWTIGGSRQN